MSGSNKPAAEIAAELGIRRNMLYKWKEQLGSKSDEAFLKQPGRPLKEEQSEVLTLKQENRRLREEVEILKKAAVDSSDQSNSDTKMLICMMTFYETYQADIYLGREKPCFRFMETRGWFQ